MSHNWRVIAPGRREMTGCIGQLIEGLVSGSATGLVPLLALPVSAHSHEGLDVLPGENVEDEEGDLDCTKRSRKSALPQNHSSKAARIDHHDMHEVPHLGDFSRVRSLSNMPSEIHCGIFAFLDDVMDVLHFSLSSRYFWAVGLLRIEEHIIRSLAPWAGEPIICIDDRCDPSKYPSGLLTPEQEVEVRELNQVYDLNSFSIKNSYKRVGGPSLSQKLQKSFLEYESHYPMPEVDRVEIMMGLKPEILEFYPRDQIWILRNLTTKEFVRGEAIALRCEFMHGPQIDVLGFAEILVSRISWSDAAEKIGRCDDVARGRWAGHRFDITPLSQIEGPAEFSAWTDVSNEILRELDLMIGGENGNDWRDKLAEQHQKSATSAFSGYL